MRRLSVCLKTPGQGVTSMLKFLTPKCNFPPKKMSKRMNGSCECRTDSSQPSPRRRCRSRRDITREKKVTVPEEPVQNPNHWWIKPEPVEEKDPPGKRSKGIFRWFSLMIQANPVGTGKQAENFGSQRTFGNHRDINSSRLTKQIDFHLPNYFIKKNSNMLVDLMRP